MAKKKITADTKFVCSVSFKGKDGKKISIMHQPYVVGIYAVGYVDSRLAFQSSVSWSNLNHLTEKKVRANIADGATEIEITVSEVGKWLSESDLDIVNK